MPGKRSCARRVLTKAANSLAVTVSLAMNRPWVARSSET